ncbi:hypothetical protein L1987_39290 [Smallanthus sonchifolius]|uniref:Uncharacterized protein n=1 Tax=Smallanthus sonchifolius TaxID=185202 RepID=A0ACB9HLF7_9ASTR|nr:hypothetical protein L1987_39290 [Smallanthus sonchifolius]
MAPTVSVIDPAKITSCKHDLHLQCILEWEQLIDHVKMVITPRQVTSRLRARPVKAVVAAKYQTVAATNGAEFFTWGSKRAL